MVRVARTFTVLLLLLVMTTTSCGRTDRPGTPISPAPTTSSAILTMPDVVGENAAVAVDELQTLGFKSIDLGTVDGRWMVILPQNWRVQTQSAKAGTRLASESKIVLGCARIGGTHWP
ncbi:PASTA domain-containing protein [Krasilnikovia cinnamomea]|uniref:PASTA domain-containing protein n=1 Tax=Krasilnikovia cinnamomea TaxID=349313 RepID=A0A4V2G7M8_9ACTN|nr:PASTA domain-containing protein [Krasilnikovia cinnamomea]